METIMEVYPKGTLLNILRNKKYVPIRKEIDDINIPK